MGFTTLITPAVTTATKKLGFIETYSAPKDISVNGHLIDWLFEYTTYLNIFFFIFVCIGLFGFAAYYHHKRNKKVYYTYGNKKLQVLVATIIGVAVFIGIDMNITRMSNDDFIGVFTNYPTDDDNPVKIEVLGQQWMWTFRYAGEDNVFNTDDDYISVNDLRLPTGRKVVFQIISKDVIHSLYFPNARRKTDAIPGRITRLWMELTTPGDYDIACAEMCGTYHYRMAAKLKVYSPEDFEEWYSTAKTRAKELNDPENADFFWGWKWQ